MVEGPARHQSQTEAINEVTRAWVLPGLFLSVWQTTLDWVFPPRCVGCGRVDTLWCSRCQHAVERIPLPLSFDPLPSITASAATAWHSGRLRMLLHALKYENGRAVAAVAGERLVRAVGALEWTFDTIVPVPLHTSRLRKRGYNQANELAQFVAEQLTIPCLPDAIQRHRYTTSQVGLSRTQRQTNVDGAFIASPELVADKSILLIDDVMTTGATLDACAQALTAAGARGIYTLTVTAARN